MMDVDPTTRLLIGVDPTTRQHKFDQPLHFQIIEYRSDSYAKCLALHVASEPNLGHWIAAIMLASISVLGGHRGGALGNWLDDFLLARGDGGPSAQPLG